MIRKIRLAILLLGGFLFVADRVFKYLSCSHWDQPSLLNKFFGWYPYANEGIAFGIPIPNWLILSLSLPLIVLAVYLFARQKENINIRLGLTLVLLGALSNFFDRLYFRHTLDYLLVLTSIFNIADILIILGAGICLLSANKSAKQI